MSGNTSSQQSYVAILAGPNGAGKSTAAAALLPRIKLLEFVNADTIARGLSEFNPESAALAAGRIMLDRLDFLAAEGMSFAFETTLASRTSAPRLRKLRAEGYLVELIFCWLPSPEMCVERVAHRFCSGGHSIPAETIHRRYHAGLRNFFDLYRPPVDRWRFYDTSDAPQLVAEYETSLLVHHTGLWNRLMQPLAENSYSQSHSTVDTMNRGRLIDQAMLDGSRRAITIHHKLGQDVVTWRDGKIAIVPAAEVLAEIDAVSSRESSYATPALHQPQE